MKTKFKVPQLGKTAGATTTYIVLAGLQRGLSLLLLPFFTHALNPSEYGAASMLTVSSAVLMTLVAAPLASLIIRSAARNTEDGPALIRVIGTYCYFLVPIFSSCIAAVFALFVPHFIGVDGHIWAIEILALGLGPALSVFGMYVTQARQDIRRFITLSVFSVLVMTTFRVLFILVWDKGILGWVLADLVAGALSYIFAICLVRLPRVQMRKSHVRYAVKYTLPLIPHSASLWALNSISRPTMSAVSNLQQVGLFSIGLNLSQFAGMILMESNRAALVRYSRETLPAPTHETRQVVKWQILGALLVPAMVGCAIATLGPKIVEESYLPSLALSGVLLIGNAAFGLYLIPMNYLTQTAAITRYNAFASFSGAGVLFASLLFVGHRFGATGAAYATSASYIVMASMAIAITLNQKIDVRWRSWTKNWPEITLAFCALACVTVALASSASQGVTYLMVFPCVFLILSSIALTINRTEPRVCQSHG
jgi:O-antigen/teichoic acid export membrane protein